MGFEFLDHTADIQVHVWGRNLEEAFEQATLGLMNTMTSTVNIEPAIKREIEVKAPDKEMLLVDYLTEYLAIFDIDGLIFSKIEISPIKYDETEQNFTIKAVAFGEEFNPKKHDIDAEVKAITFSYLRIDETPEKTELWVIFDL